jgi:hypothetical protein
MDHRPALVALLLLSAGSAVAQVQLSHFPPNPGVLPGGGWRFSNATTFANPPPQRAWVNGVYGSVPKVFAVDTYGKLPGVAGPTGVTATTRAGLGAVARGVARCAVLLNPACLAYAGVAGALYEGYRIYADDGDTFRDPGQDQVTSTVPAWYYLMSGLGTSPQYTSQAAAAQGAINAANASGLGDGQFTQRTWTGYTILSSSTCAGVFSNYNTGTGQTTTGTQNFQCYASGTVTTTACPVYIDFFGNSQMGNVGADGKCPTSRPHLSIPIEDIGDLVDGAPDRFADDAAGAGEAAADAGESMDAEGIETSGPSSLAGDPTTTTTSGPTGTTTTTTVNNYTYNYAGDTVTYNTTTTTTTVNPNGDTTTETTEQGDDGELSECEKSPDTLGCARLDVPTQDPIPETSIPVSITPQGGWGDSGGSCPEARYVETQGHTIPIPFDLVCTYMAGIRPIVIAVAWLAAAFIVFGGGRPE